MCVVSEVGHVENPRGAEARGVHDLILEGGVGVEQEPVNEQEGFDGNDPIASLVEPLGYGDERSVEGIKSEEEDKAEIVKPHNGRPKRFSCPISLVSVRF